MQQNISSPMWIRTVETPLTIKPLDTFNVFSTALSDSRTAEEKAKIVDEFFNRYETEVAKRPEDHGMDYVHAYMVIRKN